VQTKAPENIKQIKYPACATEFVPFRGTLHNAPAPTTVPCMYYATWAPNLGSCSDARVESSFVSFSVRVGGGGVVITSGLISKEERRDRDRVHPRRKDV
jgi:hypothetical protein